jgi:hypothetical protein
VIVHPNGACLAWTDKLPELERSGVKPKLLDPRNGIRERVQ